VDEAAEDIASPEDPGAVASRVGLRGAKVEPAMRASPGVVIDVLGEDGLQVASAEDQEVVEALSPNSAHPAFRIRVRPWGAETWRLEPEGGGTRLFVDHRGFDTDDDWQRAAFEAMSAGWGVTLLGS
jgi:hypothetical protein